MSKFSQYFSFNTPKGHCHHQTPVVIRLKHMLARWCQGVKSGAEQGEMDRYGAGEGICRRCLWIYGAFGADGGCSGEESAVSITQEVDSGLSQRSSWNLTDPPSETNHWLRFLEGSPDVVSTEPLFKVSQISRQVLLERTSATIPPVDNHAPRDGHTWSIPCPVLLFYSFHPLPANCLRCRNAPLDTVTRW